MSDSRKDVLLLALQAEVGEGPRRQEVDRPARDPTAAGRRERHVADLALEAVEVERDDPREAEVRVALGLPDREAGAAAVLPPTLVPVDPARDERCVGAERDAREALDAFVGGHLEHGRVVLLPEGAKDDEVVCERWVGWRQVSQSYAPWHFLYFLPEPQGHGSFRPTLSNSLFTFGFCATGVATEPPPEAP